MVNFTYFGEGGRGGLWEGPKNEAETMILVVSQVIVLGFFSSADLFPFLNLYLLIVAIFKLFFTSFGSLFNVLLFIVLKVRL